MRPCFFAIPAALICGFSQFATAAIIIAGSSGQLDDGFVPVGEGAFGAGASDDAVTEVVETDQSPAEQAFDRPITTAGATSPNSSGPQISPAQAMIAQVCEVPNSSVWTWRAEIDHLSIGPLLPSDLFRPPQPRYAL
jgi:hypothetical protein